MRPPDKDIDSHFSKFIKGIGYKNPTAFQLYILPYLLNDRDTIIETENAFGKTSAILFSVILNLDPDAPFLIISQSPEFLLKVQRILKKITGPFKKSFHPVILGINDNIKNEYKLLNKGPNLIIGTTKRIIDHIRRDNISVNSLAGTFIVEEGPGGDEFNRDVEFIFSKIRQCRNINTFIPSLDHLPPYTGNLRRPVQIRTGIWDIPRDWTWIDVDEKLKIPVLIRILLANNRKKCIILCSDVSLRSSIIQALNGNPILSNDWADSSVPDAGNAVKSDKSIRLAESVSGHDDPRGEYLVIVSNIGEVTHKEESTIEMNVRHFKRVLFVCTQNESNTLHILEEKAKVTIKKTEHPEEFDVLKGTLRGILEKIKKEEDPQVLDYYRKIIRKTVPIHMRAYVAAYLLKSQPFSIKNGSETKTLFVSVGKSKRIFARDIANHFSINLDVPPDNIKNIKVLENYSFVDISSDQAQAAIDKLNGTLLKGRKISVNFARKKEL